MFPSIESEEARDVWRAAMDQCLAVYDEMRAARVTPTLVVHEQAVKMVSGSVLVAVQIARLAETLGIGAVTHEELRAALEWAISLDNLYGGS